MCDIPVHQDLGFSRRERAGAVSPVTDRVSRRRRGQWPPSPEAWLGLEFPVPRGLVEGASEPSLVCAPASRVWVRPLRPVPRFEEGVLPALRCFLLASVSGQSLPGPRGQTPLGPPDALSPIAGLPELSRCAGHSSSAYRGITTHSGLSGKGWDEDGQVRIRT